MNFILRSCYSTLFLCFLISTLLSDLDLQIPYANASSESPYESGYDHGCSDSKVFNQNERYINQPAKGPNFHTDEFMRGYNEGYILCSQANDPCNYHGLNICDSSGDCDSERFDCYSDDCVDGGPGITGQCDGDDEPYRNNGDDNSINEDDLPLCDGSYQDCVTENGYFCKAGSTDDNCEL